MKITQEYLGFGLNAPKEIDIEKARKLFRTANKVKRVFNKVFLLSHGVKGRIQVRSVIHIH